jgi:hypothetical protein
MTAAGPTGFSGVGPNVPNASDFSADSYDLSEGGAPAGYSASAWVCIGGAMDDADTITNDDIAFGDVIFKDSFESD